MTPARRSGVFSTLALFILGLGGCAMPPPSGPSVMVMPGKGKNFDQFRADNAVCRQYASEEIGISPAQGARHSFAASTAAGTVMGAVAGAAIGAATGHPATGAAIGAGGGATLGALTGLGAAQSSGGSLQHRYNIAYTQCMAAKGENVKRAWAELQQEETPTYVVSYPPNYGYYGPPPFYYGPGFFHDDDDWGPWGWPH